MAKLATKPKCTKKVIIPPKHKCIKEHWLLLAMATTLLGLGVYMMISKRFEKKEDDEDDEDE